MWLATGWQYSYLTIMINLKIIYISRMSVSCHTSKCLGFCKFTWKLHWISDLVPEIVTLPLFIAVAIHNREQLASRLFAEGSY